MGLPPLRTDVPYSLEGETDMTTRKDNMTPEELEAARAYDRQQQAAWRAANPEKYRQARRKRDEAYRDRHREERREYDRQRYHSKRADTADRMTA